MSDKLGSLHTEANLDDDGQRPREGRVARARGWRVIRRQAGKESHLLVVVVASAAGDLRRHHLGGFIVLLYVVQ